MAIDRITLVTRELERTFGAYRLVNHPMSEPDRQHWSFIAEGGFRVTLDLEDWLFDEKKTSSKVFQQNLGADVRGIAGEIAKLALPPAG